MKEIDEERRPWPYGYRYYRFPGPQGPCKKYILLVIFSGLTFNAGDFRKLLSEVSNFEQIWDVITFNNSLNRCISKFNPAIFRRAIQIATKEEEEDAFNAIVDAPGCPRDIKSRAERMIATFSKDLL